MVHPALHCVHGSPTALNAYQVSPSVFQIECSGSETFSKKGLGATGLYEDAVTSGGVSYDLYGEVTAAVGGDDTRLGLERVLISPQPPPGGTPLKTPAKTEVSARSGAARGA